MDVTRDVIEKIEDLAEVKFKEIDGKIFSDKIMHELDKEEELKDPGTLGFSSLDSILGYYHSTLDAGLDRGKMFFSVDGDLEVRLFQDLNDKNKRLVIAEALPISPRRHSFNGDIENFIVHMLSRFEQTETLEMLLKMVSNITDKTEAVMSDTGFSQSVGISSGVEAIKVDVKNPVHLKPYMTFTEIEQPVIPFIFRITKRSGEREFVLMMSESPVWKIFVKKEIKNYLENNGVEIPVLI